MFLHMQQIACKHNTRSVSCQNYRSSLNLASAGDFLLPLPTYLSTLYVTSQFFGAVAGLLTEPHWTPSGDRPDHPKLLRSYLCSFSITWGAHRRRRCARKIKGVFWVFHTQNTPQGFPTPQARVSQSNFTSKYQDGTQLSSGRLQACNTFPVGQSAEKGNLFCPSPLVAQSAAR